MAEESVLLNAKRAFPFRVYGRTRPGRTASSTAVPGVLLTRKRSHWGHPRDPSSHRSASETEGSATAAAPRHEAPSRRPELVSEINVAQLPL